MEHSDLSISMPISIASVLRAVQTSDWKKNLLATDSIFFTSSLLQVPEGLEASLRLMLPGELAIVNSVSKYAYDNFPRYKDTPVKPSAVVELQQLLVWSTV